MRFAPISIGLAGTLLLATGAAQAASTLAPHRAVYDLSLANASDRSGISGISGRMVYEFDGSTCDGYTVNFRFVTRILTEDVSRVSDIQTSSYEDGEGENFTFMSKSFVDEQLEKEVRGSARMGADGLSVSVTEPEERDIELDHTQFPTQHLIELIDKARAQETFYESTIFDASEDADKVMTTTAVVGRAAAVEEDDPEFEALGDLSQDEFWPVDMAYFDMSDTQGEELPIYRIGFKLHENGVTRDLSMDYGEFAMTGRLVDLTLFDKPDCAE